MKRGAQQKQRLSGGVARKPSIPVADAAGNSPDAEARRRLSDYLLSVMEDPEADSKRRDEMAAHLSKVLACAQPRAGRPPKASKAPAQPRVSTYASKKREAESASRTAQKNSPWDGLVNGSSRTHDEDHIEVHE
jgi:hypothetical protein